MVLLYVRVRVAWRALISPEACPSPRAPRSVGQGYFQHTSVVRGSVQLRLGTGLIG